MSFAQSYQVHSSPELLLSEDRNKLIISYVKMADGREIPLSRYGDETWNYTPFFPHAARGKQDKEIVWKKTPEDWRPSMRSAAAAFTFRAAPGGQRLDPATVPKRHVVLNAFAKWCDSIGIKRFADVRAFDLRNYLQKLRDSGVHDRTLAHHISVLRKVYELRAVLEDSFTAEAVRELSFDQVGPLWEPEAGKERRTELLPLAEASSLFVAARTHLVRAAELLRLRDDLAQRWAEAKSEMDRKKWGESVKRHVIWAAGFRDVHQFESAVSDIRTAAYVVLALTTGCRVHELGEANVRCVYSQKVGGETYWWLKSATRKIGDGPMRWLAPAVAKEAVDALEWYSAPLRLQIAKELSETRELLAHADTDKSRASLAVSVLELERNANRLFLSDSSRGVVSTDTKSHNKQLKAFGERMGLKFGSPLATHRFRRTYAVIAVHLNKGPRVDLVTLQQHFKHSSLLLTQWYAELTETDRDLYELIDEESIYFDSSLIDHWLEESTPLAGGFGSRIKAFAGKNHQPMLFKSRREFVESICDGINIRSTGHSWCLAEAQDCGGRGLFEAPSCGDCGNGVIDNTFTEVWQNLRRDHEELLELDDIGPGGRAKAKAGLFAADAILARLTKDEREASGG